MATTQRNGDAGNAAEDSSVEEQPREPDESLGGSPQEDPDAAGDAPDDGDGDGDDDTLAETLAEILADTCSERDTGSLEDTRSLHGRKLDGSHARLRHLAEENLDYAVEIMPTRPPGPGDPGLDL